MMRLLSLFLMVCLTGNAATEKSMQEMFLSLEELSPYLADENVFLAENNHPVIAQKLRHLQQSFTGLKHEQLLKKDIFAPSYLMLQGHLGEIQSLFDKKQKREALWNLRQVTSFCIDCHTRLPVSMDVVLKIPGAREELDPYLAYNIGIRQLILRNYFEAKHAFCWDIDWKLIRGEGNSTLPSFKQLALIELKVNQQPAQLLKLFQYYQKKKNLPLSISQYLSRLTQELSHLSISAEMDTRLKAFEKSPDQLKDGELLIFNGRLSQMLYKEKVNDEEMAKLNYWLGLTGQSLEARGYQADGIHFLLQCFHKYPHTKTGQQCQKKYRELTPKSSSPENDTPMGAQPTLPTKSDNPYK